MYFMKRWTLLYENCKLPIRIAFFGFILIALGSFILNDSVNVFYTFTNPILLQAANLLLYIGQTIITILPLFFLTNLVAKKANSGVPMVMAIAGYIAFVVVTMIFGNSSFSSTAYVSNIGISYTGTNGTQYPLNTGLIGAFLVAFTTRYSYIRSRNPSSYSLFGFMNRDTVAIIYNIFLCIILGFIVVFLYPICYAMLQDLISYIARDLADPIRIGVYGAADRIMSMLGVGDMIREPFWYGSQGGSYMTLSGQTILGDVNIWNFMQEASASYVGCGRFITPYYVINIFIVPAIYLGMFFSMTDKRDKKRSIAILICLSTISIIFGNPLPLELLLLFTSPLLLALYLLVVMIVFGLLSFLGVFLGFSYSGSTAVAMPGAFPDYIIQLRNPLLFDSIITILIVGVVAFIICFILTKLYYGHLAYNLLNTNKTSNLIKNIDAAIGGLDNITSATSGIFKLNLYLKDLEAVSFNELLKLGANRITETREGLSIEFGSSSTVIAKAITKEIAKSKRQ